MTNKIKQMARKYIVSAIAGMALMAGASAYAGERNQEVYNQNGIEQVVENVEVENQKRDCIPAILGLLSFGAVYFVKHVIDEDRREKSEKKKWEEDYESKMRAARENTEEMYNRAGESLIETQENYRCARRKIK